MFSDDSPNIFSQNYSHDLPFATQQSEENDEYTSENQNTENDNSSNTVEEICEETHQLGGMVTASLESLIKRNIKLKEGLMKIDFQLMNERKVNDEQKKTLIYLQMENEELGCQNQQEVDQRKELIEKIDVAHEIVSLLVDQHCTELEKVTCSLQDECSNVKDEIAEQLSYLKQNQNKKLKDISELILETNKLPNKLSTLQDDMTKYKEKMMNKIFEQKTKFRKLSEKRSQLEQEMIEEMQEKNQLSEHYNAMSIENDDDKKEISVLKMKSTEVQNKKCEEIPKLNLKINNERNIMTNENNTLIMSQKHKTELNMKVKQAGARVKQLKTSVTESRQSDNSYQENIVTYKEKMLKLKILEEKLQKDSIRRQNIMSEKIYLRQKLDEGKVLEENLSGINDNERKKDLEVDNQLNVFKKEVEETAALNDKLNRDNYELQNKAKQLELAVQEDTLNIQTKRQVISATTDCKKDEIIKQKAEKGNKINKLRLLEEEYTKLVNEKEDLDRIYDLKTKELEDSQLKFTELQDTFDDYLQIYDLAKEDLVERIGGIENCLVQNLEKMKDPFSLEENLALERNALKQADNVWLAEKTTEVDKFNSQMKDMKEERQLYQDNIDAISKQEKECLHKTKDMIRNKKQIVANLEIKLKKSRMEIAAYAKKKEERQKHIVLLEDKLRRVSDTAKVTKQDIKEAFAPVKNLQNMGSKQSYTRPNQHSAKKPVGAKQESGVTKPLQTNLKTPSSTATCYGKDKDPLLSEQDNYYTSDPFDFGDI